MRRWFADLARRWQRVDPRRRRHFYINLAVGLAIELVLISFKTAPVLVGFENMASDFSMRIELGLSAVFKPPLPFALIDVDEETWRDHRWGGGEPYYAPRDRLAELIRFAAAQKPRFVVLDIFTENPPTPDDDALLASLKDLDPDIDYIFVRSLQPPLSVEQAGANGRLVPKIQTSRLDEFLESHGNFHIAAPYFQTSRDGLVRSWRLWTVGCRVSQAPVGGNRLEVIPSVQLVVSALYRRANLSEARDALSQSLRTEGACETDLAGLAARPAESGSMAKVMELAGGRIARAKLVLGLEEKRAEEGEQSRILYRSTASGALASIPTVSALSVLRGVDGSPAQRRAVDSFRRRSEGGVILIGQSFTASGDLHPTPIGAESGSAIILNAITSILTPGVIRDPPPVFEWAFIIASIATVAWIFACANSVLSNARAVVLVLILVVPASLVLLHLGYWLNFAAPLVGIAVHRAFAEVEEAVFPHPAKCPAKCDVDDVLTDNHSPSDQSAEQ